MATKKKKTSKKSSKKAAKFGAKAAFVREMPRDMPAKEVVGEAKKRGMHLTIAHVYNVRSTSGASAAKKGKTAPKKATRKGGGRASSGEAQLRQAIADIGLVRATEILEDVKATIRGQ